MSQTHFIKLGKKWRLVWTEQEKKVFWLVLLFVLVFSSILGFTAWNFFSRQQEVYASVSANWKQVERYYQFLQAYEPETELVLSFGQASEEELNELAKLKADYESLNNSLTNDLNYEQAPESPVAGEFYAASRDVLIRQQSLTQASLRLVSTNYCLQTNAEKQAEVNQSLATEFAKLEKAKDTAEVKKIFNKTSELTKGKSILTSESADCFLFLGEEKRAEAKALVEPIQEVYKKYQAAVKDFLTGIDKLDVKQTSQALESIKQNEASEEDLKKFDTFVKTSLEAQHSTQVAEQAELDNQYQALKQSFLEIRLRTIFK